MTYKQLYDCIRPIMEGFSVTGLTVRLDHIYKSMIACLERGYFKGELRKITRERETFLEVCNSIVDIVRMVESGQRADAFAALYNLYFMGANSNRLNLYKAKCDTSFYRMRRADSYTQYTKKTPDEMYHIPFHLRHLVDNERYSITGFPTFYLSSSVYGCWEECQRCNLDFSNVALFKSTEELTFVDMIPPKESRSINPESLICLPLIIASRLKVVHKDGKFIPEYIIPQLVMECLIAARKEDDNKRLVGIRYESIHQDERDLIFDKFYREDLFWNFAVPPFESKECGVCAQIRDLFTFWSNTSWAEIQYRDLASVYEVSRKENDRYKASRFGIIEKFLGLIGPEMLTYRTRTKNGIPVGALSL